MSSTFVSITVTGAPQYSPGSLAWRSPIKQTQHVGFFAQVRRARAVADRAQRHARNFRVARGKVVAIAAPVGVTSSFKMPLE